MPLRIIIFLSFWILSFPAMSQGMEIDELMKIRPVGIGAHKVDTLKAVYLPMDFAGSEFLHTWQLHKIPAASYVYSVNLVYTRFREVDTFDQPALNTLRYRNLKELYPQVFQETDVQWNVWEQRSAKTQDQAMKCFHGFVIYLKNIAPPEEIEKEVSTISSVLDSYKDTLVWVPEQIVWKVKKRRVETGYYLPRNDRKKEAGEKYHSRSVWFREPEYEYRYDSSIRNKTGGYWKKIGAYDTSVFKGTDEFNLLTRRKWSPKMAVVTDVTGSMSPYSTQVMLWLKYSPEILKQGRIVFFNDGDATPDLFKKTGATGGIYIAESENFDSVYSVMKLAMRRGLGGDLPENNLEAVLRTIQKWPDTDTILMIADINAAVKDISLLPQVNKPVSVMLCGIAPSVPPDYISIIKATGGRLFMLNTEIAGLKGLYTGQRMVIGGHLFEWRNNTFQLIH